MQTNSNKKRGGSLFWIAYYCLIFAMILLAGAGAVAARYRTEASSTAAGKVAPFVPQLILSEQKTSPIIFSNVSANLSVMQDFGFTVQNYKDEVVTGVDVGYSLVFYIPQTFAKTAVFQILDGNKDAVTGLYNIVDILKSDEYTTNSKQYETETAQPSKQPKWGEETLTKSADGVYNVTAGGKDIGTVTIEQVPETMDYYLLFGVWVKQADGLMHLIDPTLQVNLQTKETYYKVTVTRPDVFVMDGGKEVAHNMTLRLIPREGMTELPEGATTGDFLDGEVHSTWDSIHPDALKAANKTLRGMTLIDNTGSRWGVEYDSDTHTVKVTDHRNTPNDPSDDIVYEDRTDGDADDKVQIGHLASENSAYTSSGKVYPCRLSALFVQLPPPQTEDETEGGDNQ